MRGQLLMEKYKQSANFPLVNFHTLHYNDYGPLAVGSYSVFHYYCD